MKDIIETQKFISDANAMILDYINTLRLYQTNREIKRLEKILKEDYIRLDIHDFILKCVEGHCNILVSGETGSGKTEFVKYLGSHIKENEKIINQKQISNSNSCFCGSSFICGARY